LSERRGSRELVLDTSVAVKFYLPEDLRNEALRLLGAVEGGQAKLLAPGTVQPELLNALWQQYRRGVLSLEEASEFWFDFSETSLDLYAPEDLMPRAAEMTFETGVIVYDALFLALAEDAGTVVVTADGKLLKALERTTYAGRARYLGDVDSLIQSSPHD
jgi:predicted nucleic acid-binding protein